VTQNAVARLILVAAGLLVLAYAYPGLVTLDSVDQLGEARAHFYTDAHPPVMALIWGALDHIIAGTFLMLVLQGVTFLAGLYLIAKRFMPPRAAAITAAIIVLFPPVLTPMAFIWKDSLMAGLLALGAGLLLSPCSRARNAALAVLWLATAVKYNAFCATLPLVVLLYDRRWFINAGIWLAITISTMAVNSALVDQPMHYWHSSLAIADIAGVIRFSDVTDDELRKEFRGTPLVGDQDLRNRIIAIYTTKNIQKLVVGDTRVWDLPVSGKVPAPQDHLDAMERAWKDLVFGHPGAYLRHRWGTFLDTIGVTYRTHSAVPPRLMKWTVFMTNLGLPAKTHHAQEKWSDVYEAIWRRTPLFRQWIYLVLALVLIVVARRDKAIVALLASGLVAEASLFFLAPSPDYRYSHWLIVVACVSLTLLIYRRVWARDTADRPAASPRDARAR
jgi:hypothetical protein